MDSKIEQLNLQVTMDPIPHVTWVEIKNKLPENFGAIKKWMTNQTIATNGPFAWDLEIILKRLYH